MKTAKILEITDSKERQGPNGTIHYIWMKLDNGETISLWKKKPDALKVGDTVNYEVVEEWRKWKEVKIDNFSWKKWYPEANNRWAMIGMAIKLAFDKVYQWEDDYQKAAYLSQRIFELAMEMYNWPIWWNKQLEQESAKDDKLPF